MMNGRAAISFSQVGLQRPVAYTFTQTGRRNAMAEKDNQLQVSREAAGARWAALLRAKYGTRQAAKCIARDFSCETRTAKAWLAGQSPQLRHFLRAAQLFGISAVVGVLWPESHDYHRSKIHDDLLELRSRLDLLSRELGGSHHDEHSPEKDREKDR
jgi:hypothetical protein